MSELALSIHYYHIPEFEYLHSASLTIKIQIEVISSGLTTINRKGQRRSAHWCFILIEHGRKYPRLSYEHIFVMFCLHSDCLPFAVKDS